MLCTTVHQFYTAIHLLYTRELRGYPHPHVPAVTRAGTRGKGTTAEKVPAGRLMKVEGTRGEGNAALRVPAGRVIIFLNYPRVGQ